MKYSHCTALAVNHVASQIGQEEVQVESSRCFWIDRYIINDLLNER